MAPRVRKHRFMWTRVVAVAVDRCGGAEPAGPTGMPLGRQREKGEAEAHPRLASGGAGVDGCGGQCQEDSFGGSRADPAVTPLRLPKAPRAVPTAVCV